MHCIILDRIRISTKTYLICSCYNNILDIKIPEEGKKTHYHYVDSTLLNDTDENLYIDF